MVFPACLGPCFPFPGGSSQLLSPWLCHQLLHGLVDTALVSPSHMSSHPVIGIPKLSQEGCEAHHLFHLELPNQSFLGPEARSPSLLAATRLALVCLGNRSLTSVQAGQEGGLTHNSLYTLKSVEEGAQHSIHGDSKI